MFVLYLCIHLYWWVCSSCCWFTTVQGSVSFVLWEGSKGTLWPSKGTDDLQVLDDLVVPAHCLHGSMAGCCTCFSQVGPLCPYFQITTDDMSAPPPPPSAALLLLLLWPGNQRNWQVKGGRPAFRLDVGRQRKRTLNGKQLIYQQNVLSLFIHYLLCLLLLRQLTILQT